MAVADVFITLDASLFVASCKLMVCNGRWFDALHSGK
jgi:hypothetical protein